MRFFVLLQQAMVALALTSTAAAVPAVTLDFEEFSPADARGGAPPTMPVEPRGFVFAAPMAPPDRARRARLE